MIKRVVFILSIALLSINSIAQKVIQMENINGVYRIACSVNGAKMKMIFDTGASNVSLSESMANFLYDNEYISKEGYSADFTDSRLHHEIYLSDARRVAPEKLKTVIRHPIKKVIL